MAKTITERTGLLPEQRSMRAAAGGRAKAAKYDGSSSLMPARDGFMKRFRRQVDPNGTMHEVERERRAQAAMSAHMAAIAFKRSVSAQMKAALKRAQGEAAQAALEAMVFPPVSCPACYWTRAEVFPEGHTSSYCKTHAVKWRKDANIAA